MPDRQRIRLVAWLQQLWQQQTRTLEQHSYEWGLLVSRWESLRLALHRWQLAEKHGLKLCLPELQRDLLHTLRKLEEQIATMRSCYDVALHEELPYRHWFEEVEQLYAEFNTVTFQPEEGKLRVETPVITLVGICLGPFAIDFRKKGYGISLHHFEIEALQPEPASTDSELTHPHVKGGELCAGDAKAPMRAALESGRLVDTFLLIQSVLQTYNPRSAYGKLDQWYGIACSDCARTIDPEDSISCQACEQQLCDQCYCPCSSCSTTYCPACMNGCSSCKSSYCEACLEPSERNGKPLCFNCRTSCGQCGKWVSTEEIDEEEQICLDCVDLAEEEPQCNTP